MRVRRLLVSVVLAFVCGSLAQAEDERPPLGGVRIKSNYSGPDPLLQSAVYSYRETFKDSLRQDAATYISAANFDRLYPDSLWKGFLKRGLTNEDGSLAWLRSRDMMALTTMYEVTGDPRYLDRAFQFAKAALAARDDKKKLKDDHDRISPAWGASVYGNVPKRTVYIVHSALVIEPILTTLCLLDGKLPSKRSSSELAQAIPAATAEARRTMLKECIETMTFWEPQYKAGPAADEGYYFSEREEQEREKLPEPYNRQNVMALNFHLMHLLTGEATYADRAARLARFFRNRLELTANGCYLWSYEPVQWETPRTRGEQISIDVCDDISHGFYAIEPIPRLVEAGIVFTAEDLTRFAHTLTRSIYRSAESLTAAKMPAGGPIFLAKLGCEPSFHKRFMIALPGWLITAPGDAAVYPMLRDFMLKNLAAPAPLHMAYLLKYRA